MAASVGVTARTLVAVFGCVGIAAFVYGFATDRYASCIDLHNRWLIAAYVNFYINVAVIAAWVMYKESSWIVATVLTVLLICLGSITTSAYVIMQFFKLSPEELAKDPIYFVLARRKKRNDTTIHRKGPSVVTTRVIFSALACFMLATFIYTLIVDGSPIRASVFTPCVIGAMTDFYANAAIISVWIAYKESSWINAFFWILLLVCFGSISTCVYIVRQLFYLSPRQNVSLIIFNDNNRDLQSRDPLLIVHANV